MHTRGVLKHCEGVWLGLATPGQWVCAGGKAGDGSGTGDLTRKLLSLGLVARLRPRRMLSFLSDTLDRVTLPGAEERSSVYTHFCLPSAQSLLPLVA